MLSQLHENEEKTVRHIGNDESLFQEYLHDVRAIFPLLQELAGCLTEDGRDDKYNTLVYGKLSHAVSMLSATVQAAGMAQQSRLMQEFHFLLEKLHSAEIFCPPELSGLTQDFLQFLEVSFTHENPENRTTIKKVQEQLQRFKGVLATLGQEKAGAGPC